MKFPPDLIARVQTALQRTGYCFFGVNEIERLLGERLYRRPAGHAALQDFAGLCGAEVETTSHLKSARFTPAQGRRETTSGALAAFFQTSLEA